MVRQASTSSLRTASGDAWQRNLLLSLVVGSVGAGWPTLVGQAQTPTPSPSPPARLKQLAGQTSGPRPGTALYTVTADAPLADYASYQSGDRFYVTIPDADAAQLPTATPGRGYEEVQILRQGQAVVLTFQLQTGAQARVTQQDNRLDIIFQTPEAVSDSALYQPWRDAVKAKEMVPLPPLPVFPLEASPSGLSGRIIFADPQAKKPVARRTPPRRAPLPPNPVAPAPLAVARPDTAGTVGPAPRPPSVPANAAGDPDAQHALGRWGWLCWAALCGGVGAWWAHRRRATMGVSSLAETIAPAYVTRRNENVDTTDRSLPWTPLWDLVLLTEKARLGLAWPNLAPAFAGESGFSAETCRYSAFDQRGTVIIMPETTLWESPAVAPETTSHADSARSANTSAPSVAPFEIVSFAALSPPASHRAPPEASVMTNSDRVADAINRLLAGADYDAALLHNGPPAVRQEVAAALSSALEGTAYTSRERVLTAFVRYGYLAEAQAHLQTGTTAAKRSSAARVLGFARDARATPALISALHDPQTEVRRAAVQALAKIRDAAAITPLQEMLTREDEPSIPRALIQFALSACQENRAEAPLPIVTKNMETIDFTAPASPLAALNQTLPASEEERLRAETEKVRLRVEAEMRQREEELRREVAARLQAEAEKRRQAEAEAARWRTDAEERRQRVAAEEARVRAEGEALRRAHEEATRQLVAQEAARRAEWEARRQADEENARREADATRRRIEEEAARHQAEENARLQAETDARRQTENELLQLRAELEAQRQAREEAARRRAEIEAARRQAEADARRQAAEEARLKAEAEARQRLEAARRQAEADARRRIEAEYAQQRAEEETRLQAEAEARRQAEAEAARLRAEAEKRRQAEIETARRLAEEEARLKAEAEARQRAEQEAAHQRAEQEAAHQRAEQEAARQKREDEARRLAAEEMQRQAEAQARLQVASEARRQLEAEIAQLRAEAEAEKRRIAEEMVSLQAEDEAYRQAQAEAEQTRQRLAQWTATDSTGETFETFTFVAPPVFTQPDPRQQQAAEAEARRQAHEAEQARRYAAEQARREAEAQQQQAAAEQARRQAEEAARRQAEEAMRRQAEEMARQQAEQARREAEAEQARREAEAEAEAAARRWAEIQATPEPAPPAEIHTVPRAEVVPYEESWNSNYETAGFTFSIVTPSMPEPPAQIVAEPHFIPVTEMPETPVPTLPVAPVADKNEPVVILQNVPAPAHNSTNNNDSAIPAQLLADLQNQNTEVRAAATLTLARLEVEGDEAFAEICKMFDDPIQAVRDAAARSLYNLTRDRAAIFTRALREATPDRRRSIGASMSSSGLADEAISNLVDESREKTYDAFSFLFLMSKAGEVQPLLRAIKDHPSKDVRLAVVRLLALSGQPEVLPAFRRLAVRGSLPTEVRSAVMEAIFQISSQHAAEASNQIN